MEMTNENLNSFREDFKTAVAELEKKYDVTISLGRITYSDERFSASISVKNGNDPEEIARADFDADVWKFEHLGFERGMFNRIVICNDGKRYALRGFQPRAKKYPIKAIRVEDDEPRILAERFIKEITDEYYVICNSR